MQKHTQTSIREEELKNRVATVYFGKYDCTRIVGNIDFCVSPKRRDPRQMTFISDPPILWAEAKNHPTDVHRMLAQLILTIKGEQKGDAEPPRFVGCFDNEKIAFVEYHYILPVFNLNDFNWTQTPSAVDDKTVETIRGVIPADKIVVFSFGADDAEIKVFIARNFTSGDSPALATPIDRNNFTFIYQKWRQEVMPYIDAPWDVLKKKYALYDRDFFFAEMNVDDNGTPEVTDDRPAVFDDKNRVKSADGVNHWIPFTETEVDAKSCFKSHFMSDFLGGRVTARSASAPYQGELEFTKDSDKTGLTFIINRTAAAAHGDTRPPELQDSKTPSSESNSDSAPLRLCVKKNLSPAARAVLDAGRELWRYYHAQPNANPNASYYDIRLHFQGVKKTASGKEQMNATSSDATYNALLAALRSAHKVLAAQIAPKVYEYGFLKM